MEHRVTRDASGRKATKGSWESKDLKASLETPACKARRVTKDSVVIPVYKEIKDDRETREAPEMLEVRALRVGREIRELSA